ncbi:MAG: translation elongation factor Ts [Trueperaceae bacterium]|nr:MAG: translation elongation factor Ts [Trueperaceae bacterium]
MSTNTEAIKKLRALTGAGMMDVKKSLDETGGDIDKAAALLRERGIAKAAKKSVREAREGIIGSYVHHNGRVAVLVELNCETDFVARNDQFKELAKNLALHVAMANPQYLRPDEVPQDVIEAEKQALRAQALEEGKPEAIVEKMVEGRIGKYYAEVCLLEQPYIKDDKLTVEKLLAEAVAAIGENIQVGRFSRIAIGE